MSMPNAGAIVQDVKELTNTTRQGAAKNLVRLFVDQSKAAVKEGTLVLPANVSAQDNGTTLGLRVEHALYHIKSGGLPEPNEEYKNQLRAISFNVKKNAALALRLLASDLSPHGLASMDPKDMASEEQKHKDAAIIKELEKQHTIVADEGPRIRRTHKGDEYIHESDQVATESTTSNAPVRKASVMEQDGEVKSPVMMSPKETKPAVRPTPPTSRPRQSQDPKRQSSSNFDIDKVWSNVQGSPEGETSRFGGAAQSPTAPVQEPAGPGAKPDADIDDLLRDEDAESAPYSPKETVEDPDVLWHGVVKGNNLCHFQASAKYALGAKADAETLRMTWSDIIPAEITIGGRIKPSSAEEYLCGLEYSTHTDVVVVYIPEPSSPSDRADFGRLFDYLKNRDRYGVGTQHENSAIKDIYLLPLEKGQDLPDFVTKMLHSFSVAERMLLMPIVIKNSELPHMAQFWDEARREEPRGAQVMQTPITPHEPQFAPPPGGIPYNQPPAQNGTPQPQQQPTPTPQPQPAATPTPQYANPYVPPPSVGAAAAAAQRVLGPQANAPAVVQLIQSAPSVGDAEMMVVKECIQENPQAAEDLAVLTGMLQAKS